MSELSRRRLLAAAGAAVAGAGCTLERDDANGETAAAGGAATTGSAGADGSSGAAGASSSPGSPGADGPYARVYEATIGSVVSVRVFDGDRGGSGSGFVQGDGTVVTNQHVVAGAEEIELGFSEGEWRTATVLGTDAYADLAALAVEERPGYATPLSLLRSDPPVGTRVVALGNPFGYEASATSGIVSGVDRTLSGPNDFPIPDAVQTDAAVNPGNSGGPLVTLGGDVVGVVTRGGGDNVGFAVSSPLVRRVVPALVANGRYRHPYVGVRLLTVTPTVAAVNDLDLAEPRGVLVAEVVDGGPADGVLEGSTGTESARGDQVPVDGDVILAMGDTPTPTLQQLTAFVALETSPGQTVSVTVLRDGERRTLDLTLGERPPA